MNKFLLIYFSNWLPQIKLNISNKSKSGLLTPKQRASDEQ